MLLAVQYYLSIPIEWNHGGRSSPKVSNLSKVLKDSLSVDKLLGHETGGGKHSKTSVLEFLGSHDLELFWVGWLEAKWVESDVTRNVAISEETRLVHRDFGRVNKADFGTLDLGGTNGDKEDAPEDNRNLCKVGDGWSLDGGIKEERRSLDLLTDKEANGGEHGNTSVGKLGSAVTLEGVGVGLFGESKGIKESHRGDGTWEISSGVLEGGDLLLGSGRGEGSGGTGKEGEGGNEFHFDSI